MALWIVVLRNGQLFRAVHRKFAGTHDPKGDWTEEDLPSIVKILAHLPYDGIICGNSPRSLGTVVPVLQELYQRGQPVTSFYYDPFLDEGSEDHLGEVMEELEDKFEDNGNVLIITSRETVAALKKLAGPSSGEAGQDDPAEKIFTFEYEGRMNQLLAVPRSEVLPDPVLTPSTEGEPANGPTG
jgi:hypothetical protein